MTKRIHDGLLPGVLWAICVGGYGCGFEAGSVEPEAEVDAMTSRADQFVLDAMVRPDARPDVSPPDATVVDAAPREGDICSGPEYLPPVDRLCDRFEGVEDNPSCAAGYLCLVVRNDGPDAVAVCVAPNCTDVDGDGYGVGDACAGPDCNDCDVTVNAGAAETCNGVDDNCNGAIDEMLDPNLSPLTCLGLGVCEGSQKVCRGGEWVCDYPPTFEAPETRCDNLDNDCDGRIDNVDGLGDACVAGEGACAQSGVWICDGARGERACSAAPLEPVEELCNGVDDDCNGAIDDVAQVGQACTLRSGTCESSGAWMCDPVAGRVVCSASTPSPSPEICDRRDNDCDGEVDELLDCPGPSGEEVACDNRDDDGDGAIDEDLTRPCESACGPGEERCLAGDWQPCDAPPVAMEVCNEQDDDCDGSTDERGVCGVCDELPDGTVHDEGVPGDCGDFADECDETGTQIRVQQVCRDDALVNEPVDEACARDTDGRACRVGGADGRCERGACVCRPDWAPWRCADQRTRVRDDGCGNEERDACQGGRICDRGECVCQENVRLGCHLGDVYEFDSCNEPGRLDERCPHGCGGDRCLECVPNPGPWRCSGAASRVRDDGCGREEFDNCPRNQVCDRDVCVCQENVRLECRQGDVYEIDSCGEAGRLRERCQYGCERGRCPPCVPDPGPWRCDGDARRVRDDGCEAQETENCGFDEICDRGACEPLPCCEMDVDPSLNRDTAGPEDTQACNAGGGYLYRMRATDIRYDRDRNGEMTAVADLEIRKFDGSNVGGNLTVWIVTAGDHLDRGTQMLCNDRHAYDVRTQTNWAAGTSRLVVRNVPIWPNEECSSLPDGHQKKFGVITDDGAHRGQRIWMSRELLVFTKNRCR